MGPERKIQEAVVKYAKARGVLCMKMQASRFGSVGWPDYFFFYKGQCLPVEFKAPKAKATPIQVAKHEELKARGFCVILCSDTAFGIECLDTMTKKGDLHGMATPQVPAKRR